MDSSAADLKKWLYQRRLAEAREKAELRDNAPEPVRALERGFALIAFAAQLQPRSREAADLPAEDLQAYRRWAAVRTALRVA
jgi:hypothetical protein